MDLSENNLGPEGAAALAPSLGVAASITHLDVRYNDISGEGASQLSAAVLSHTKMEVFNDIPVKEMRADSLTELKLDKKRIGVVRARGGRTNPFGLRLIKSSSVTWPSRSRRVAHCNWSWISAKVFMKNARHILF